eukprot:TRINITY_DN5359_c0_g1_i1.p1 TRINITY_DN5359_c0_g1~~TRINITY_DN5359_c0_g1_i1.p1  ORF type:complete len:437 (-),score=55.18 TRINITY_DN5359_c0_g1_i1:336-1646(-)
MPSFSMDCLVTSVTAFKIMALISSVVAALNPEQFELMSISMPPVEIKAGLSGPYMAPSWQARVQLFSGGKLSSSGMFWREGLKKRWRMQTCVSQTIFRPTDKACLDQLMRKVSLGTQCNITVGEVPNQVCKAIPRPYYDQFFSMEGARHIGSTKIAGEVCEIWKLEVPLGMHQWYNISACLGTDGVPRQYNTSSSQVANKLVRQQRFSFRDVRVGAVADADAVFENSEVCRKRYPMPPCPNNGVQTLDLYRLHGHKEPLSLRNRDVGDALGDMGWFCELDVDLTKLVTHWKVEVNSSWGQYAYCLYVAGANRCYGSTGQLVGRESALGLGRGAIQGQCSTNDDVGSWFSFPAEGECATDATIGHNGCTWKATPLRTVSAACIMNDRGLGKSCTREHGRAPMLNSAALFQSALASSDPAKGGCPDSSVEVEDTTIVV